jgi:hypothetical protein
MGSGIRAFSIVIAVTAMAGLFSLPSAAQQPENFTDTPPNLTTFTAKARVVPNRAGTPKDPQPVKIHFKAEAVTEPGYERPIFLGGHVLFPRHGNYNGDDFPRCSKQVLDREGPDSCPKRSRVGWGTGVAYADSVVTRPRIEFFNGGNKVGFAYVTLYRPALVQIAVPGRIQEFPSGKWKYKVSFKVPKVLQVVAGIPIAAGSLELHIGRENLIESTSCPKSRRWPYEVRGTFSNGSDYTHRDSVPCKPPLSRR